VSENRNFLSLELDQFFHAGQDANPNPLREVIFSLKISDGRATLPDTPGLGVEPDLKKLARFLVEA